MTPAHLRAFLWLRWRLIVNQFRRSGPGGAVLSGIVTAVIAVGAALALIVGIVVGVLPLRTAPAATVMLVWDVLIGAFVFLWFAGLMAELQRSDAISLDRFLHLPVSPSSAFVINYLGSSISLGLVLTLPAMTGLAIGLTVSRGPLMLLLVPLIAAFFLMMTALAYQFRGWLASMMKSPRRRQTVMAVVPLIFVLVSQLPALWNTMGPGAGARREARAESRRVIAKLNDDLAAGRITRQEYARRRAAQTQGAESNRETLRVVNMVVPPGWLAHGAQAAAEGRAWPAVAGLLGMTLIGSLSLRRAYTTTLRLYTGDFDRTRRRPEPPAARTVANELVSGAPRVAGAAHAMAWTEARIPWASERVSAVTMATLRSWSRAPHLRMTLLTPIVMLVVFSRMLSAGSSGPELLRPLTTAGLAAFVMMVGLVGPAANLFGYDASGFRAIVLSPIARRDVLVGKNLAVLPLALTFMAVVVAVSQWVSPMRLQYLFGVLLQLAPMVLLFCLAANHLSIVCPLTLKAGSGMPVPHQGLRSFGPVLFMLLSPLGFALSLLPLAIHALMMYLNWLPGFPTYPVLCAVQLAVSLLVYQRIVTWQGGLLHRREQTVLDIVAAKGPG